MQSSKIMAGLGWVQNAHNAHNAPDKQTFRTASQLKIERENYFCSANRFLKNFKRNRKAAYNRRAL